MKFTKSFGWRFSGFTNPEDAQKALDGELSWLRDNVDINKYQITSSVQKTVYGGYAAEYTAVETDG